MIAEDQREAALLLVLLALALRVMLVSSSTSASPLRVARLSDPDFEDAIEAEPSTVTAVAERGKQHISITGRANRDRQESTKLVLYRAHAIGLI